MPRFSLTSRCRVCGKEVAQSGPARQWVHINEFYAKADHAADPAGGQPYVMPKRDATSARPAKPAKGDEGTARSEANKPKTVAELRRRLQQGSAEISADDSASRRRRIAALDSGENAGPTPEADLAVKRLRMLRQQQAQDDAKS